MFPLLAVVGFLGLAIIFSLQDKKGQQTSLPPNTYTLTPEQVALLKDQPPPPTPGPTSTAPPPNYGVMTPERQAVFDTAMAKVLDPDKLDALANVFDSQGCKSAANSLHQRAQFLRSQAVEALTPPTVQTALTPIGSSSTFVRRTS